MASRPPRARHSRSGDVRSSLGNEGSCYSSGFEEMKEDQEEKEVQSPLKQSGGADKEKVKAGSGASRQLDMQLVEPSRQKPRKRKSKGINPGTQTPDLNVPLEGSNAIVPVGLVNSRVSQLDVSADNTSDGSMIETLKKQRRGSAQNARSATAVSDSPRRAQ